MNDQELTALASAAFEDAPANFSPLTDDGDAFRLAVKLRITIYQDWKTKVQVEWRDGYTSLHRHVDCKDADRADATRRAIVLAAAEVGSGRP